MRKDSTEQKRQPTARVSTGAFEKIRRVVNEIPRGRVMTYGDLAAAAGMPGAARTAGYAMRAMGSSVSASGVGAKLPWQRVLGRKDARRAHITIVDARGRAEQRRLLEREGVMFDAGGAIRLADYGWVPAGGQRVKVARK